MTDYYFGAGEDDKKVSLVLLWSSDQWNVTGRIESDGRTWDISGTSVETTPSPEPEPEPEPEPKPEPIPWPEPLPQSTGILTNMALQPIVVEPQRRKVNIRLPFTGDDNREARCYVEFQELSGRWRQAVGLEDPLRGEFPLLRDNDERLFAGCLLELSPSTDYKVVLTVRKGTEEEKVFLQTRTEADPVPTEELVPTHFVASDHGDDTRDGTSWETCWATIEKVIESAPSGSVVAIGPGWYTRPSSPIKQNLTLQGITRPTDRVGGRLSKTRGSFSSVVYSGIQTDPRLGLWEKVFPDGDQSRPVWRRDFGRSGISLAGFHENRDDVPTRLPRWERTSALSTAAQWTTGVYTCYSYNAGIHVEGTVVWLKMPDGLPKGSDPNEYFITLGDGSSLLRVQADNCRFSQLVFVGGRSCVNTEGARGTVVDSCVTHLAKEHIQEEEDAELTLVMDCLFEEQGFYDRDTSKVSKIVVPWGGIKNSLKTSTGTSLGSKPLTSCEITGYAGRGGRLAEIRDCTFNGLFNGVGAYNINLTIEAALGLHVHGCTFVDIADDCFEPEYAACCQAFHDNVVDHALVWFSGAPLHYGPIYLYRNEIRRLLKPAQLIYPGGSAGGATVAIKDSGASGGTYRVRPTIFLISNTIYVGFPDTSCIEKFDGTDSGQEPRWVSYNNIFAGTRYAAGWPPYQRGLSQWPHNNLPLILDYNHYHTIDPARGNKVYDLNCPTWSTYLKAMNNGVVEQHSNLNAQGLVVDFHEYINPQFIDPEHGDLSLHAESFLRGSGTPIGNIVEIAHPNKGARPK